MGSSILRTSGGLLGTDREEYVTVYSSFHKNFTSTYPGKIRSLGSCTSSVIYSITGSSRLACIGKVKLWDIAPCIPLIQEAGGCVCTSDGSLYDIKELYQAPKDSTPLLFTGRQTVIQEFIANYLKKK